MDSSNTKNPHLGDTLKDLNSAIEDWDKITSKPEPEQGLSRNYLEKDTLDLLEKLSEQIKDLSEDNPPTEPVV